MEKNTASKQFKQYGMNLIFKQLFIKFLKEHNAYEMFMFKFNNRHKNSTFYNKTTLKNFVLNTKPDEFIFKAFNWGPLDEPVSVQDSMRYWNKLSSLWRETIPKI